MSYLSILSIDLQFYIKISLISQFLISIALLRTILRLKDPSIGFPYILSTKLCNLSYIDIIFLSKDFSSPRQNLSLIVKNSYLVSIIYLYQVQLVLQHLGTYYYYLLGYFLNLLEFSFISIYYPNIFYIPSISNYYNIALIYITLYNIDLFFNYLSNYPRLCLTPLFLPNS